MRCCPPLALRSRWSQSLCSGGRHGRRRGGLCEEKTTKVGLQHKDPDFPDSHDDRVSQQHEEKGGRASAGKGFLYLPERYMSQILISQQSPSSPLKTKQCFVTQYVLMPFQTKSWIFLGKFWDGRRSSQLLNLWFSRRRSLSPQCFYSVQTTTW